MTTAISICPGPPVRDFKHGGWKRSVRTKTDQLVVVCYTPKEPFKRLKCKAFNALENALPVCM
eukprot:1137098-Pelagomonas_calceolata.AAC.2